jgi:hypothetical protein
VSSKTPCRAGFIAVLSLVLSTTIAVALDHGHGHETYSDHDRDIHDCSSLPSPTRPGQARSSASRIGAQVSGSRNSAAGTSEEKFSPALGNSK